MKRLIAVTLTLIMAASMLLMAGCKIAEAPQAQAPAQATETNAPAAQADTGAVVAKVGDKEITLGEYQQLFEQFKYYYSMFGMDVSQDPAMLAQLQDMVRDALLEKEIVRYQAKQNGVDTLSEAQLADATEQAQSMLNDMREQFTQMAEEAKAEDATIDIESYVENMIADEAEYSTGKAMSAEEYKQWIIDEAAIEHLRDNLIELTCKDVAISDEVVQKGYDEAIESDKQRYTDDPSAFKAAEEAFICGGIEGGNMPVAYAPEGYSRVMDMLVTPKADVHEMYPEYEEKIIAQDELKHEYGDLAFEDAAAGLQANNARLKAIISEYNELKKETDTMMEEVGKEAKTTIEEAYAKLQGGASFESLQLRYTENEASVNCEALMMQGQFINPDANDGTWSDECIAQFKKLKVGEYSPIFMDDEGYHILYYCSDVEAGPRAFDAIKEDVRGILLEDARYAEWQNILQAWIADESVEVYEDVYRQLGA